MKEPLDPRSSMWAWIACMLKHQRVERGLTGDAVARLLHCSRATISRLENGEARLTDRQAALLDTEWRLDDQFQTALYYARQGHDPGWLKNTAEFEARATVLRVFNDMLVPGLLQTPEYMRALLLSGRNDDVDAAVRNRLSRQKRMTGPRPPRLWVLLAETVLWWPVGGADVMRSQLLHLRDVASRPDVIIRIVPRTAGAYEGLDGSFKIYSASGGDNGFSEAVLGGRLIVDVDSVRELLHRFEQIGSRALPVDSTPEIIGQALESL